MEYTLAHGTANDFVVFADLDGRHELSASFARALSDRHRGLGADGVLRIGPGKGQAQVFMDHRNADGSTAEMCGNGIRVVAKYVIDRDLVRPDAEGVIRIGTRAGLRSVVVHTADDGLVDQVTVDMGPPILSPADIPFETDQPDASLHELQRDGQSLGQVSVVSMGNPHAVLQVEHVETAAVGEVGPRIATHARFPAMANVGFAQVIDATQIGLRVWERGVGETQACGTGACAAVVALQRQGLLGSSVEVHLPGGTLTVLHEPGGSVLMTGPAVEIATADLDVGWLKSVMAAEAAERVTS